MSRADFDAARTALSRAGDRVCERRDALSKLRASADTPLPTRLDGELNIAQAEWRVAQAALEKTQVCAPADGMVLRVDAKAGELAIPAAGPPIMSIGDVGALRAPRLTSRIWAASALARPCPCAPALSTAASSTGGCRR
jgi:multidrug resistance efflux pump